jgi:hypothetical protein
MSGTATQGSDYALNGTAGQVTIPVGQASATVPLKAKKDSAAEATETAIMTLQQGPGYRLNAHHEATVSILDGQ